MSSPYVPEINSAAFWMKMPDINPEMVTYAVNKLPLVQAMLNGVKADIACFHIDIKGRRKKYSCTLWKGNPTDGYTIHDGTSEMTQSTLSEICGGFAPLARHLSQRWPERARPGKIGISTDGHRIVFNPEHPSCQGEAWMAQHLSCRSPCTIIADDQTPGPISKICP